MFEFFLTQILLHQRKVQFFFQEINQNFLELQRELTDTETKIQASRQFYNTVVMGLNTQIEQFPSSIVANICKITPEKMFEIDEAERVAPQVKF